MKEPTQIITVNQKKNAHLEDDYSRDEEVYLDYDTSIYDFIHQDNTIILRKYKEEILKVFPEDLSFIVQTQMDGKSHFLVADRKCSKKNNQALTKVRHYIDSYPAIKNLTDFHLEREFDCKETNIEECQLTERSYIIKQKDDKKVIYNFKKATIAFDEVYNDENLRELLGENKVLVSEKLYAPHSQFIEDTITFGINPDTLEENTPI